MDANVTQWIDVLNAADITAKRQAARMLAQTDAAAVAACVSLVRAAGEQDEEVRQWACDALEQMGPPCSADVPALTGLVQDACADVGYWAVTLLGRRGNEAASAVGALTETLDHGPHAQVRQRAAWALGHIGPAAKAASDALSQAVESDDPRLARLAQNALRQVQP